MRQRVTFLAGACCLALVAVTASWAFDDAEAPAGLTGVLAAYAPDGLTAEDFDELQSQAGPNWQTWFSETSSLVQEFYEGDHPTADQQRAIIKKLQHRLKTVETALEDPRYHSIRDTLLVLYGRLAPRVGLAEAMLDTLTLDPAAARAQRLSPAFQQLKTATSQLQSDLQGYRNGHAWVSWINLNQLKSLSPESSDLQASVNAAKTKLEKRESYSAEVRDFVSREPFLALEDALAGLQNALQAPTDQDPQALRDQYISLLELLDDYDADPSAALEQQLRDQLTQLRNSSPDGGQEIAKALSAYYLNYNLRVVASEGLVNRFFSEIRQESSRINEQVMEAWVAGCQTTLVDVRLDLLPSAHNARMALTLSGNVRTNTNGYTSQATVHTVGNHTFYARKPVTFDGFDFYPEPATVSVQANNQTVDATTKFSRVPLLGRIADRIAMREATSRTPQANAIATNKIRSQVGPELDAEARQQFSNASKQLQTETYARLRKYDLFPDPLVLHSTDKTLTVLSRTMGAGEVGGSRPVPIDDVPTDGMVAQLHESLMTNAFERLGLNGQTLTEEQTQQLLEDRLSDILGKEVRFQQAEPTTPEDQQAEAETAGNTMVFAEQDAIRFTVRNGQVTLIIRAGLQRDNGDNIPTQIISVPFTPSLSPEGIVLTRGTVGVKPVETPPNVAAQVARANVMRQKIQSALPERTIDSTFVIEQQGKKVTLNVVDISAAGGWLTLEMK